MSRRVFDLLASAVGAVIVVTLVVAGSLALWAHSYANSNVRDQLAQQQIYFPPKAVIANPPKGSTEITPAMKPYLLQYGGKQLLTGDEAEAYANHFIAIHLSEMPYGGVYSKISAAAMTSPNNASLKALEQTSFQGTTLRGMLLEAYGFSTFGVIAYWAAIAAFSLAFLMAVLVGLGVAHARRTSAEEELAVARAAKRTSTTPAVA
jgi:hypothetical protein